MLNNLTFGRRNHFYLNTIEEIFKNEYNVKMVLEVAELLHVHGNVGRPSSVVFDRREDEPRTQM